MERMAVIRFSFATGAAGCGQLVCCAEHLRVQWPCCCFSAPFPLSVALHTSLLFCLPCFLTGFEIRSVCYSSIPSNLTVCLCCSACGASECGPRSSLEQHKYSACWDMLFCLHCTRQIQAHQSRTCMCYRANCGLQAC